MALVAIGLAAGCAATGETVVPLDEERRGYRGILLQAQGDPIAETEVRPEVGAAAAVAAGVGNLVWIPWRATFGVFLFVLAGDCGPIPFTGFRWLGDEASPWLLRSGDRFWAEDVYAAGQWPRLHAPWIGKRGPDPILLPSRADP